MNDNSTGSSARPRQRLLALAGLYASVVFLITPTRAQTPVYPTEQNSSKARPLGGLGVGFSGHLPQFVVQVPASRSEVSGELVSKLGLSWVRDWLKDTPYEGTEPPVAPPLRLPVKFLDRVTQDAWFVGRLGFTPIGTVAGLTSGALSGESAKRIDQALPAITNVMAELQIPGRFEPLLLGLLREKWPGVILFTNSLPHESTFLRSSLMNDVVSLPQGWDGLRESRVNIAPFPGADAAVVLRVVSWGLMGRAGRNSPLAVKLTVKATLVNLRNRSLRREFYAEYESGTKSFVSWSDDAGQHLREELLSGIQDIADQITSQVPVPVPEPTPFATRRVF